MPVRELAGPTAAEGQVAADAPALGVGVGPRDAVSVDGKPVSPVASHTYLVYHKPRGLLCSRKDARGRPLIYDSGDYPATLAKINTLYGWDDCAAYREQAQADVRRGRNDS